MRTLTDGQRLSGKSAITARRILESRKIREEVENGWEYDTLDSDSVREPVNPADVPSVECLKWHNENVFLG